MAQDKKVGQGFQQSIYDTANGIKQVTLNNSEPAEFFGDPRLGGKEPAEDILDKIKDQCKLLGKNFGFLYPEDDGIYATEYKNGRKPCEYEHVKLTSCKVKEMAFGQLQGEDRDVNVCNYTIDFGMDTSVGIIIRKINFNDGINGTFYGYYTTNVYQFLRDNGFGAFNGGPQTYTLSQGLVEILDIEFDYFDNTGTNVIANATISKTSCSVQRLKGRQNNGYYVLHYNYNNGPDCDYQLKKMDKIIRGRRINEGQQVFDMPGGTGNQEFEVEFDNYITDYQPLVATPNRFIIPVDRRYSMRIKANIYGNNVHAFRLFVKNYTTGQYYLLDPRKSGAVATFNASGALNDLRLEQQTPQTDSNGDTEPTQYQMRRMSENHGFAVSLDYMKDPGTTLFEMDELPMKAGDELGVVIRIAGTNDNTNPGKVILAGQVPYNPPVVGDGGTKRFIKSEPDYGLFN